MIHKTFAITLFVAAFLSAGGYAVGQPIAQFSPGQEVGTQWLIGQWEGAIERFSGKNGPNRTLRVLSVSSDGIAEGGWAVTGNGLGFAEIEVQGPRVKIVTSASSLVDLLRGSDGSLAGTFTLRSGRTYPISLVKSIDANNLPRFESTDFRPTAKSPRYLEGQFWQFKLREWDAQSYDSARLASGIYEISYSQDKLKAFYFGPGDVREELEPVPPLLMRLLGRGRDFKFPLIVGQKWAYEYTERITLAAPCSPCFLFRTRAVEINVVGLENATTEAGTVEAFKLVKEDRAKGSWYRWVTTYFVSRASRNVVKMFLDTSVDTDTGRGLKREIELIKYGGPSGRLFGGR